MLKRTLAAPPTEDGSIAGYTSELSQLLRSGLPGERVDEIIAEAEAHLHDKSETIAQGGNLPRREAEARAVAEFTPAVQFAREMTYSTYESRHSGAWRTGGAVTAAALFSGLFGLLVISQYNTPLTLVYFTALLFIGAICAFQARQAQTRRCVLWGALAAVAAFFFTGFFYLDGAPSVSSAVGTQGSRASVKQSYLYWHEDAVRRSQDMQLLQIGLQTYQAENPVVPDLLKGINGSGYLVPGSYLLRDTQKRSGYYPFRLGTPETVPTLDEARARWRADGSLWLARIQQAQFVNLNNEKPLRVALEQTGFAKTAPWYAGTIMGFAAVFAVCDGAFAVLGRVAYNRRRARRKPKRA